MDNNFKPKSKWPLIRNAIKAIHLLKTFEAKQKTLNQILNQIQETPLDYQNSPSSNQSFLTAVNNFRKQEKLFECAQRGTRKDLELLKVEVDGNCESKAEIVNKPDRNGQTLLYLASKNGNIGIISFLLVSFADPFVECVVDNQEQTCLEVAARWNQLKTVQYLVEKVDWPKEVIARALRSPCSESVKSVLKGSQRSRCRCF